MRHRHSDDLDDAWDDDESPEETDDEPTTVRCPACGAEVYEDAVRCPACGEYITADTSAWSGRPTWWIVLGLIGLVATVLALTGVLPL